MGPVIELSFHYFPQSGLAQGVLDQIKTIPSV